MYGYTMTIDVPEYFASAIESRQTTIAPRNQYIMVQPLMEDDGPQAISNIKVKWTTRSYNKNRSVINRLKLIA